MLSFQDFEKIDAHMHYNSRRRALLEYAIEQKFHLLTINTDIPFFPPLKEQREIPASLNDKHIAFLTTFTTEDWDEDGWEEKAIKQIEDGLNKGAIGVKIWKNIGMALFNKAGKFIMIDDSSFDPVITFLERNNIPLLGHLGEPRNCWLPIDEMTVDSDKEYFEAHPEYHMFKHPGFPSYEEQILARDHMLDKHPHLQFIGAHLASLEWSIEKIAEWLDRYPHAAVDVAERICHLQYQAVSDWQRVRDFIISYQDRIIYGTDLIDDGDLSDVEIVERVKNLWDKHWMFFSTSEYMNAPEFREPFYGLALSDTVLQKIYAGNALKWYPHLPRALQLS